MGVDFLGQPVRAPENLEKSMLSSVITTSPFTPTQILWFVTPIGPPIFLKVYASELK